VITSCHTDLSLSISPCRPSAIGAKGPETSNQRPIIIIITAAARVTASGGKRQGIYVERTVVHVCGTPGHVVKP
jgi:hypothetical protein